MPITCSQCQTENADNTRFCRYCGSMLTATAEPPRAAPGYASSYAPPSWSAPSASPYSQSGYSSQIAASHPHAMVEPADKLIRFLAWMIDVLIVVPFLFVLGFVLGLIPVIGLLIGGMAGGLLGTAYFLLRDFNGASPGKMLLGLKVVSRNGQPADQKALILRNVTLAAPHLLNLIPIIGWLFAIVIAVPVGLTEAICALVKGERMGDMLAGTLVVKK